MKEGQRVYFIKPVGMDGPIKIGCSDKPAKRLLVLASWSPFELEIIGSVPGSFSDENFLHRRFADLHKRKEWFMSSPTLRHTIDAILSGIPIREACESLPDKGLLRKKQPLRTPDRVRFINYGARIRKAMRPLLVGKGRWHKPSDIIKIMHDWRCDKVHEHSPIIPSAEQIARLEEFLADPKMYCSFEECSPPPRTPICIPHIDEIAA